MLTIGIGSAGSARLARAEPLRQSRLRWTYSSSPAGGRRGVGHGQRDARGPRWPRAAPLFGVPSSAISAASIAAGRRGPCPARPGRSRRATLRDGPQHAQAAVPAGVAVAELDRLVPPGARPRRDDRPARRRRSEAIASTSTVGRPRESSTSRAFSFVRVAIATVLHFGSRTTRQTGRGSASSPPTHQRCHLVHFSCQERARAASCRRRWHRSRSSARRAKRRTACLAGVVEVIDGALAVDPASMQAAAWAAARRPKATSAGERRRRPVAVGVARKLVDQGRGTARRAERRRGRP